jgi:hypothetical protein
MVKSRAIEEQSYARAEILTCAEAILRGSEPYTDPATFAGAVREYLRGELAVEGAHVKTEDDRRARLLLADAIERQFTRCTHPFASDPTIVQQENWCNECGAVFLPTARTWVRPHWRTILLRALLGGVLMIVAGCGGRIEQDSASSDGRFASRGGPMAWCTPWEPPDGEWTHKLSLTEIVSDRFLDSCPCGFCRQREVGVDGADLGCCTPGK